MSHGLTFHRALAFPDDMALLYPSMSGLRTFSKVCEEYDTVSCCFQG